MHDLSSMGQLAEIGIDGRISIRYLKAGSGSPLVLLHTIRTQLDYFQYAIPALSKHHTVYALDLPGHGYSSTDTSASYDEPYFRRAVVAFMERLDLKDVTLVGESIGGVLSLTVASTIPQRIRRVVASNVYDYETRYADGVRRGNWFASLIIPNYAVPVHGAIFAALENWLFLGLVMRGGLRNRRWMPVPLLTELDRTGRRKGFRYVERNVFTHWRSWGEARVLYPKVKAPVTLIYGDHDWSRPAERQRTARELGNVGIVTVENSGHFGFVDNPEKMVRILMNGHGEKAPRAS